MTEHQPSGGTAPALRGSASMISAAEAARILGVKPQTLYAYVSRGLLRSTSAARGRARLYVADDVKRLKSRSDARRGHAAVAAAALDWGDPVLDSAITRIDEQGPHYRGRAAVALARKAASFESVCEWLWSNGESAPAPQALPDALRDALARCAVAAPKATAPLALLSLLLPLAGACDLDRHAASPEAEWARARGLLRAMAAALAIARRGRAAEPRRSESLAALACRALGATPTRERVRAIDQALVLSADHELNVSTFAVRVTASSGADLYACVGAGLCALSGPWHGGICERIEALARTCQQPARVREVLRERARLGEYVPGFGQPLYPAGDPRGAFLCRRAYTLGPDTTARSVLHAISDCMAEDKAPGPTIDFGLVALSTALGLPNGSGSALFALGRTAGWIAHALEQRTQRKLLRPRARYVGQGPQT